MFQQPSQGGDKVPFAEMIGALALIVVREHRAGITTTFGEKDAVAADVHVIDGQHGGEVFDNALIFQGALIGALKSAAGGDPVLARIGQGTAKPGQNPPFILTPFTEADVPAATAYWTAWQARQFQAPAQQAAAPPVPPAAAAPVAAAVIPSPAAASPATGNGAMTAEQFAALPIEVQELLRQSGQAPVTA